MVVLTQGLVWHIIAVDLMSSLTHPAIIPRWLSVNPYS
jgi:hypothetical protein